MSKPGPIYRTGLPTEQDYDDAIESLRLAKLQTEEDEECSICNDDTHRADQCHHNLLIMARRSLRLKLRSVRIKKYDYSVFELISTSADFLGVKVSDVLRSDRRARTVRARRIAAWLGRHKLDRTLEELAISLNIHHATVIAGLEVVQDNLSEWTEDIDAIWTISMAQENLSVVTTT